MSKEKESDPIYALVGNIPSDFHTRDLRHFFAQSIESGSFVCFHFRNRPEQPNNTKSSKCAICKVKANKYDQLLTVYDQKSWIGSDGVTRGSKCRITKIKLVDKDSASNGDGALSGTLSINEINSLLEFRNIPGWMPAGNVGTPTRHFVKYINRCVMPQSMISKIGLNLQNLKKYKDKPYASVQHAYENPSTSQKYGEETSTESTSEENEKKRDKEEDESDLEVEEWERHEAYHDDVTKQDRTSPYFYEHEIELKWEKGGSGLVFYTDETFWKEHEGKDFDAETADDLDLDMRVYESGQSDQVDKDMSDLVDLRRMEMLRNGEDPGDQTSKLNPFHKSARHEKDRNQSKSTSSSRVSTDDAEFGSFEKHTKGLGRKLLEKTGWKKGEPLGKRKEPGDLVDPLDASTGKKPMDKTGIGYHGAKVNRDDLIRAQKRRRESQESRNSYRIGSKFNPYFTTDNLLQRDEQPIKYRQKPQN